MNTRRADGWWRTSVAGSAWVDGFGHERARGVGGVSPPGPTLHHVPRGCSRQVWCWRRTRVEGGNPYPSRRLGRRSVVAVLSTASSFQTSPSVG